VANLCAFAVKNIIGVQPICSNLIYRFYQKALWGVKKANCVTFLGKKEF